MQSFYLQYFNPYLNFHRPCGVPERVIDAKGKEWKRYRWYAAPAVRPAPARAGRRVSRSAAKGFAAGVRISRSSRAGRSHVRKKCSVVITLAGPLTASGPGGFRLLTRSR
jgi:hypothetical protein